MKANLDINKLRIELKSVLVPALDLEKYLNGVILEIEEGDYHGKEDFEVSKYHTQSMRPELISITIKKEGV